MIPRYNKNKILLFDGTWMEQENASKIIRRKKIKQENM